MIHKNTEGLASWSDIWPLAFVKRLIGTLYGGNTRIRYDAKYRIEDRRGHNLCQLFCDL